MNDKELFEQLARGPLTRNGFDESLRRKIHERIEHPKRKPNRFWSLPWFRLSLALTFVLIIGLGIWAWKDSLLGEGNQEAKFSVQNVNDTAVASSDSIAEVQTLRSAMLIGLRTDNEKGILNSSYRTILVAPEDNELKVVADGPGIYMPFKQKFWKIDTYTDETGLQQLVSAPADQATGISVEERASDLGMFNETLLFAGNRYVSIVAYNPSLSFKPNAQLWVNEVENLTFMKRSEDQFFVQNTQSKIEDVMDLKFSESSATKSSEADSVQWAIMREQGAWVAKETIPFPNGGVSYAPNNSERVEIPELREKAIPLPNEVTGPDELTLPWDKITMLERGAKDAFTSPTEDIVAIVVEEGLHLYPYTLTAVNRNPLILPLAPNESIVMVQWAQDNYVDLWNKQLSGWIPPTTPPSL